MSMKLTFNTIFGSFSIPFTAVEFLAGHYDYSQGGEWIKGEEISHSITGMILPLTNDDTQFQEGGIYSRQDIKIYYRGVLGIGWKIEYRDRRYRILEERIYDEYTDFNIYFARRIDDQEVTE